MNNVPLKKTMLVASLSLAISGLISSTVLATPDCEPKNIELANTTESKSHGAITEATDIQITELPDRVNSLYDKPATASDVKYYSFTALRGQKLMINDVLRGPEGSYWNIEYNITGNWQPVPKFEPLTTDSLTAGQKVQLRISHPEGAPIHPDKHFHIDFGSAPYAHNVRIEPEGPPTGSYFWTSTFRHQIMWATNVRDSTGHLLEGATVDFVINVDDQNPSNTVKSQRVTVTGGIAEYVSFPDCSGRHVTPPFTGVFDFITKWRATYNTGHWHVSVRGNPATGSSPVPITQVCLMNIVG